MRGLSPVLALAIGTAIVAGGCSASRTSIPATQAFGSDVDDLPPASLAVAAERTAEALDRVPRERSFAIGDRKLSAFELAGSARRVAAIARGAKDGADLTRRLARECRAYPAGAVAKVTGYYEPVLDARRAPDARFRYPIYRQPSPDQLAALRKKLGRTPARADIDRGNALAGLGLELAWLDDPVDRFFLHVQGSGRLRFADGTESRIGFAATNDLAYQSVGAVMRKEGLLEPGDTSATAMRRWLAANPSRRDALLEQNPRYVFFRDTGRDGPVGALGATLVPGRSIATDERYVPRGMLAWLRTTKPVTGPEGRIEGKRPITRFVYAQDAGAAIEGVGRVDLFVGSGDAAGLEAGGMNEGGQLYLLVCSRRPPPAQIKEPPMGPWLQRPVQ